MEGKSLTGWIEKQFQGSERPPLLWNWLSFYNATEFLRNRGKKSKPSVSWHSRRKKQKISTGCIAWYTPPHLCKTNQKVKFSSPLPVFSCPRVPQAWRPPETWFQSILKEKEDLLKGTWVSIDFKRKWDLWNGTWVSIPALSPGVASSSVGRCLHASTCKKTGESGESVEYRWIRWNMRIRWIGWNRWIRWQWAGAFTQAPGKSQKSKIFIVPAPKIALVNKK